MEKLRDAYFPNTTDIPTTRLANINLLSDLNINYGILKNVIQQIKANSNEDDETQHKNTFLLRLELILWNEYSIRISYRKYSLFSLLDLVKLVS